MGYIISDQVYKYYKINADKDSVCEIQFVIRNDTGTVLTGLNLTLNCSVGTFLSNDANNTKTGATTIDVKEAADQSVVTVKIFNNALEEGDLKINIKGSNDFVGKTPYTFKTTNNFSLSLAAIDNTTPPANGVATKSVKATLTSPNQPVANRQINFSIAPAPGTAFFPGNKKLQIYSPSTNASGEVVVTVADNGNTADTVSVSAALAINPNIKQTTTINFVADAANTAGYNIILASNPASAPADDITAITVIATLKSKSASTYSVASKKINFSPLTGTNARFTGASSGTTSSTGKVQVSVVDSNKAGETVPVTAALDGNTAIASSTNLLFVTDTAGYNITLTTTPASARADGTSAIMVTATLTDKTNQPVAGKKINFSPLVSAMASYLGATSGTTDQNGTVQISVVDTNEAGETVSVTASLDGQQAISKETSLIFTPFKDDSTNTAGYSITLASSPASAPADGATTITVTATLTDTNSQPVVGKQLNFSPLSGTSANYVGATSGTTDQNGTVQVSVVDTNKAGETVSVTAGLDINTTINNSTSITFDPFNDDSTGTAGYSITLTSTPSSATADGSTAITVTAKLTDANNQPVTGKRLNFSPLTGTSASYIGATSGTTDQNGTVQVSVVDNNQAGETVSVTASLDINTSVTKTTSLSFTAVQKDTSGYSLTLAAEAQPGSLNQTHLVTATLRDASGNPVEGEFISFDAKEPARFSYGSTGTTSSSGVVGVLLHDIFDHDYAVTIIVIGTLRSNRSITGQTSFVLHSQNFSNL